MFFHKFSVFDAEADRIMLNIETQGGTMGGLYTVSTSNVLKGGNGIFKNLDTYCNLKSLGQALRKLNEKNRCKEIKQKEIKQKEIRHD